MKKLYYSILASICLLFMFTACRKQVSGPNISRTFTKTANDLDGDGVNNELDAYPTDSSKAYNNYFPASEFGTLMFDDVWPYVGDSDFNDLVMNYRFNTITNANNEVAEIKYWFLPRAAGGSSGHGFAFQLDNIASDLIESVSGSKMSKDWSALNANGTENGHTTHTNVVVFDDAFKIFNNVPEGTVAINTFLGIEQYKADTIKLLIKFKPQRVKFSELPAEKFNPYLIPDRVRSREIHLADRIPSAKMSLREFGKGDDNSNSDAGRYFKTKNNFPWAITIPTSISYPIEMVNFTSAYLNFLNFINSGSKTNTDWYLNKPGNLDESKLYKE